MPLLAITLNASIDTAYVLPSFRPGSINRALHTIAAAGGKGNNVARVLTRLGHRVRATGFVAGHAGRFIEAQLRTDGVEPAFVEIPGESRRSLAIIDQATGSLTEIREPGPPVPATAARRFLDALPELLDEIDTVVVSGSLPPGLPADYYATLVRTLHDAEVTVVLDSSGEPFHLALAARPDLIKPNADEMAALMGGNPSHDHMLAYAADTLIGNVVAPSGAILLSLGERGAALVTRSQTLVASAPRVQVVSTVGAGDATIAGYLDARARGADDATALRHAVAVGSASTLQLAAGSVDPADIDRLGQEIIVS